LRDCVRELERELFGTEAFVHRTHAAGDTLEGDFFEAWAEIAGRLCKARVFVATLPCSNVYSAKAYPIERLESLLDGLNSSFEHFGGLTRRVVLDNTSLAVKKILVGTEREETKAFHGWRGPLPLHADFCAPASGDWCGSVWSCINAASGPGRCGLLMGGYAGQSPYGQAQPVEAVTVRAR